MTRAELSKALKRVILLTLGLMAASYVLLLGVMLLVGLRDAALHYTIATVFTLILAPAAGFPLIIASDRLRATKGELESLLRIDSLTELPNRRAFFERFENILTRSEAVTLMMIDVDNFKLVNDNYGHDRGDEVLRSVAASIQEVVAAAPGAAFKIAARLGGEEFAVLLEGVAADRADRLADDLVARVCRKHLFFDDQSISVTVSIGVAHRRNGEPASELLRAADAACYRAKRLGRNRWLIAESESVAPQARSAAGRTAA